MLQGGIQMKRTANHIIVAVSVIALVSIGSYAFAGWGMGYGRAMHGGMGHGPTGGGYNCPYGGPGMAVNPDSETAGKLQKARQAFFQETADLRGKIRQKAEALEYALSAADPNPEEVSALQKDLSDLRAEFDQKRVAHRIEMRKSFPELAAGYGRGRGCRGMGRGHMMGHGPMGYGPGGGGHMGYGRGMHGGW
jgi:Spy/CpxP family protein refolding chaperone